VALCWPWPRARIAAAWTVCLGLASCLPLHAVSQAQRMRHGSDKSGTRLGITSHEPEIHSQRARRIYGDNMAQALDSGIIRKVIAEAM
jgi:hypothetical protein